MEPGQAVRRWLTRRRPPAIACRSWHRPAASEPPVPEGCCLAGLDRCRSSFPCPGCREWDRGHNAGRSAAWIVLNSGWRTRWFPGGFARHERGFHCHLVAILLLIPDPAEHDAGGHATHILQRLPDGGQAGRRKGGGTDVIEAHDRNILWHPQFGVAQGADGTDCGHIVEGEEGAEALPTGEQLLNDGVAEFR